MGEITSMTEPTLLREKNERLPKFLHAAIGHFRNGDDIEGMEDFLSAVEELERVVEADQKSARPKIVLEQLLPAVRGLYFYMQNQDIAGIADLLEFTVCPLAEKWLRG